MDLEKQEFIESGAYLIRDRFHLYDLACYPRPEDLKPYFLGKGDEDWCITQLNNNNLSYMPNSYFQSFLLIKNIDFSEFDVRVKAKGPKYPVCYHRSIKLQDNPQVTIASYCTGLDAPCLCRDCRKDYRAIEVFVRIYQNNVYLHLKDPIK